MSQSVTTGAVPIVDGHVHIGEGELEPGRPGSLEAHMLLTLMDGPFHLLGEERRIDHVLAQPNIFMTREGDPWDHHRYVAESAAAHPDRITGCFVVNPLLPVDRTLEVLTDVIENHGFRGIKLHPMGHGYAPARMRDRLEPVFEIAATHDLPVIVHQGDPPYSHPTQFAPLAEEFSNVRFILAHLGTQRVVMAPEAIYVATKIDNIYLETGWGALPRIKEALAVLDPGRLVFASDCPIQEMGSQLRVLEVLTWDPPIGIGLAHDDLDRMMGGTIWSLMYGGRPAPVAA
jgi:predicted TIM-barrel fold metal-dependent hydrolase